MGRVCSICSLLVGEVGVLVELGLEALHLLEALDELRRGRRRPSGWSTWSGLACEALRLHELAEVGDGLLEACR